MQTAEMRSQAGSNTIKSDIAAQIGRNETVVQLMEKECRLDPAKIAEATAALQAIGKSSPTNSGRNSLSPNNVLSAPVTLPEVRSGAGGSLLDYPGGLLLIVAEIRSMFESLKKD